MGAFESTNCKILDKEEIDKISNQNPTLEKLFNRFKNINGVYLLLSY